MRIKGSIPAMKARPLNTEDFLTRSMNFSVLMLALMRIKAIGNGGEEKAREDHKDSQANKVIE